MEGANPYEVGQAPVQHELWRVLCCGPEEGLSVEEVLVALSASAETKVQALLKLKDGGLKKVREQLKTGTQDYTYRTVGEQFMLSEKQRANALQAASAPSPAPARSKPVAAPQQPPQPPPPPCPLRAGQRIRCLWDGEGKWYTGCVSAVNPAGFQMLYDLTTGDLARALDSQGMAEQEVDRVVRWPLEQSQKSGSHYQLLLGRGALPASAYAPLKGQAAQAARRALDVCVVVQPDGAEEVLRVGDWVRVAEGEDGPHEALPARLVALSAGTDSLAGAEATVMLSRPASQREARALPDPQLVQILLVPHLTTRPLSCLAGRVGVCDAQGTTVEPDFDLPSAHVCLGVAPLSDCGADGSPAEPFRAFRIRNKLPPACDSPHAPELVPPAERVVIRAEEHPGGISEAVIHRHLELHLRAVEMGIDEEVSESELDNDAVKAKAKPAPGAATKGSVKRANSAQAQAQAQSPHAAELAPPAPAAGEEGEGAARAAPPPKKRAKADADAALAAAGASPSPAAPPEPAPSPLEAAGAAPASAAAAALASPPVRRRAAGSSFVIPKRDPARAALALAAAEAPADEQQARGAGEAEEQLDDRERARVQELDRARARVEKDTADAEQNRLRLENERVENRERERERKAREERNRLAALSLPPPPPPPPPPLPAPAPPLPPAQPAMPPGPRALPPHAYAEPPPAEQRRVVTVESLQLRYADWPSKTFLGPLHAPDVALDVMPATVAANGAAFGAASTVRDGGRVHAQPLPAHAHAPPARRDRGGRGRDRTRSRSRSRRRSRSRGGDGGGRRRRSRGRSSSSSSSSYSRERRRARGRRSARTRSRSRSRSLSRGRRRRHTPPTRARTRSPPRPRPHAHLVPLGGLPRQALPYSNGCVLMCDDLTQNECLSRGLLGAGRTFPMAQVHARSALFLLNVRSKQLLGVFVLRSEPGHKLVPEAWGGAFPVQFPVRHPAQHRLRSLPMERIRQHLPDCMSAHRLTQELSEAQANALVGLFASHGVLM